MNKRTLTKFQLKQYEEIKRLFNEEKVISISDNDYVRFKEVLLLLSKLEYIVPLRLDDRNAFLRKGDFADFEKWHKEMKKEEHKLSIREWLIGIVGALIGLIPFIITTVVPWLVSLFR